MQVRGKATKRADKGLGRASIIAVAFPEGKRDITQLRTRSGSCRAFAVTGVETWCDILQKRIEPIISALTPVADSGR